MSEIKLEQILAVYNTVVPSRTRQIRNRNQLKNSWKELFKVLEQASGRDGVKVTVFDPNWHEVGSKGAGTGVVDKVRGETDTQDRTEENKTVAETTETTPVKEEVKDGTPATKTAKPMAKKKKKSTKKK